MLPVSLFNVARYLTDSLRGPVLQTLRRARGAFLLIAWARSSYIISYPSPFLVLSFVKLLVLSLVGVFFTYRMLSLNTGEEFISNNKKNYK